MLTKRTNVLFDEGEYSRLVALARARKVTLGYLIREAVKRTHKRIKSPGLGEMLAEARRIGVRAKIKPHEWKEFINEGRKL